MKTKAKFSMFVAACALLFSSLPVLAGPANSPQTEGTTQTQSVQKGEKQKGQPGPGKDVGVGTGKGAAKIGKGSGKGIGKLGKKIFGRGGKNKKNSEIEN